MYSICMIKYQVSYKSNKNVVYSCKYHVIWCPKYRRKVLCPEVSKRLKDIIETRCKELKSKLIEMEIMPDHIHILVEADPQMGIHLLIKRLKGQSSRRILFTDLCYKSL